MVDNKSSTGVGTNPVGGRQRALGAIGSGRRRRRRRRVRHAAAGDLARCRPTTCRRQYATMSRLSCQNRPCCRRAASSYRSDDRRRARSSSTPVSYRCWRSAHQTKYKLDWIVISWVLSSAVVAVKDFSNCNKVWLMDTTLHCASSSMGICPKTLNVSNLLERQYVKRWEIVFSFNRYLRDLMFYAMQPSLHNVCVNNSVHY